MTNRSKGRPMKRRAAQVFSTAVAIVILCSPHARAFPGFLLRVDSIEDWDSIALGSGGIKYVGPPQRPEETDFPCLDHVLYGPGVQHIDIIRARGLECMKDFDASDLNRMRLNMTQFAGYISRLESPRPEDEGDRRTVSAFTIHNDLFADPEITIELVVFVLERIRETYNEDLLGRLVYLPTSPQAKARVSRWIDDPEVTLPFETFFLDPGCSYLVHGDGSEDSTSPCGRFVRGDINVDDQLRPGDAVSLLEYLFRGAEPPVCLDAADTNDDGRLSLGDAVYLLRWLYLGGPSLTDPSPSVVRSYPLDDCGTDPTEDALDCVSFSRCE